MYQEYFENKEKLLLDKLSITKKELSEIRVQIKENERFLEILDKSNTAPFTEFTPQVVPASDKKKQEALISDNNELNLRTKDLHNQIKNYESELQVIKQCLSEIKHKIAEQKNISEKTSLSFNSEKQKIVESLNSVLDIVVQDPMRAKINIKEIIKSLEGLED